MQDDLQPDAADDGSPTERVALPSLEPATAPGGSPVDEPTDSESLLTVDRFAPASAPRADWADDSTGTSEATPERWYEPAPSTEPVVTTVAPKRARSGVGTVVGAAILSAVLASGGTVLALEASGALDRPVEAPIAVQGTNTGTTQPVAIDESSATINVAAKVSPA